MATASATVIGSATLTGSTPAPDSAPTTYVLQTAAGSYTFSAGSFDVTSSTELDFNRTKIVFANGRDLIIPTDQLSSFLSGLLSAKSQVDSELASAATTVPSYASTLPEVPVSVLTTPPLVPDTGNIDIPADLLTVPPLSDGTTSELQDVPVSVLVDTAPIVTIDEAKLQADLTEIGAQANADLNAAIEADLLTTQSQAVNQDQANFKGKADWRVRLSLAPDSKYFYNASNPGIMAPLIETNGVIFPYTPSINVSYTANYDPVTIAHSNYKIYQYSGSAVEQVTITCDFTCQDTFEANYLLAVIHFFRSMTKMFYGQDTLPKNGTPPPLCYMFGMGGYQFAAHPLAISGFSYNLPADVDYIKTTSVSAAGTPNPSTGTKDVTATRLSGTNVGKGGTAAAPVFQNPSQEEVSWVPTKIQLSITCLPIVTRNSISNKFSLENYATGNLLVGTKNPGGGIW